MGDGTRVQQSFSSSKNDRSANIRTRSHATQIAFLLAAFATVVGAVSPVAPASNAGAETAPSFVTKIPAGYRDWKLISVAREDAPLSDIRAILGNDVAIKAYREGTLPFPDGTIITRIAWSFDASDEDNKLFCSVNPASCGHPPSFVAGAPKNGVQFMVKDSKKYAATGGWGFGQFDDGKPASDAVLKTCFPCHSAGAAFKARDLVFTRYAP